MAGRAPRSQIRSRKVSEARPRSPTTHPGTSGRQSSSPGPIGSSWARRQREGDGATTAIRNHAGLGAAAATRAAQRLTAVALLAVGPPLVSACRLLVGANGGAVEKGHAEGDPALLDQVEQALPDPEMRPADEGLRRLPPGPELAGDTPPLGAVLVPPEDGLDRLPQVVVSHLAVWPDLVDQRLQLRPPRVCQNVNARVLRHPRQLGTYLRG